MKHSKHAICAALLAIGAVGASAAQAVDALAAIEIRQQGAVPFVSGGVGEDERQAIKDLAPDYSLELLFATRGSPNEYLADVKVQIRDKDSKVVLDAVSDGPFLLAKLPPGKYSISADLDGVPKQQTIQVSGGRPHRLVFVW